MNEETKKIVIMKRTEENNDGKSLKNFCCMLQRWLFSSLNLHVLHVTEISRRQKSLLKWNSFSNVITFFSFFMSDLFLIKERGYRRLTFSPLLLPWLMLEQNMLYQSPIRMHWRLKWFHNFSISTRNKEYYMKWKDKQFFSFCEMKWKIVSWTKVRNIIQKDRDR